MDEPTYTPRLVIKLLRSYLDFRHALLGEAVSLRDVTYTTPKYEISPHRRPLGMTDSGSPWPFMDPQHARHPRDGKGMADRMLAIHVQMLDLEAGLKLLSDDDLALIYKYHLFQTHTLDELCLECGIETRGGMSKRVHQAVRRLTCYMEQGPYGDLD